jgi:hypothetical protein
MITVAAPIAPGHGSPPAPPLLPRTRPWHDARRNAEIITHPAGWSSARTAAHTARDVHDAIRQQLNRVTKAEHT